MEQNIISKKELLDLTGISYGQLYRWKRKNLIPEEWFIKKSSFTGQETFFPKDKILERIGKIMNMKEDLSLDDIAGYVSPNPVTVSLSKDELKERSIVSEITFNLYFDLYPAPQSITFDKLLAIYIVDKLLVSGEINIDEGKLIFDLMENHYASLNGKDADILLIRKMGVPVCVFSAAGFDLFFDSSAKIAARVNISKCTEELKIKV